MPKTEITKSALAASLRDLMKKKELAQITIKDITAQCRVSRNAFYYHFRDKYDLINWIFYSEALPRIESFSTPNSYWNGFVNICKYMLENRSFYLEVFRYTGQNSLIGSLRETYFELMKIHISSVYLQIGYRLTEDDLHILARMEAHAYVGIILDWVNSGMQDNYITYFEKLKKIRTSFVLPLLGSEGAQECSNVLKSSKERPESDMLGAEASDGQCPESVSVDSDVQRPATPGYSAVNHYRDCEENALPKQYADIVWNIGQNRNAADKPRAVAEAVSIDYQTPAPTRGINMLLAKYCGRPYRSEVPIVVPPFTPAPRLKKRLADAKIAFVTDGGLVPRGNPDNLVPINAEKYCIYSFGGKSSLLPDDYEVSHQGYENRYVLEDPNRLIPLDAARLAEARGQIRKVSDVFFSTAGVMVSVENSKKMGREIAICVVENEIDGVMVSSTCGTSTRCGAYISCEIEQRGIPVVHVTNLIHISEGVGCSRILQGNSVSYLFGDPSLSPKQEQMYRMGLFEKGLELLLAVPKENSCLIALL